MKNCKIIAEVGSVHDGSFGNAMNLIKLAKECDASAVKFQTHIPDAETLKNAPMPPYFKGEPRYDYFKRTGFSFEEWENLKLESDNNNIEFLSSPFSIEAVTLLEKINIKEYKIPSGEVTNLPLLEAISDTQKPILISSGMSSWKELDIAINTILNVHSKITVLQCTSEYPCSDNHIGLNIMLEMKDRYKLPVGLSDHSMSNYAVFAAVALGASVIEKHLTFSKKMYGSDAKHSSEPLEFIDMVKGVRSIETIISSKIDKNLMADKMKSMKNIFQKSIVSLIDIPKGFKITKKMIGFKKPGTGIPASDYKSVLGKIAKNNIKKDNLILSKDLI